MQRLAKMAFQAQIRRWHISCVLKFVISVTFGAAPAIMPGGKFFFWRIHESTGSQI
jgi:hypothetical protein